MSVGVASSGATGSGVRSCMMVAAGAGGVKDGVASGLSGSVPRDNLNHAETVAFVVEGTESPARRA